MLCWVRNDVPMKMSESSRAVNKKLQDNNNQVCDEDYTGEYIVAIHNDTNTYQYISHGDRIAQLVFLPYLEVDFVEVNKLEETERGAGGFGSTGK